MSLIAPHLLPTPAAFPDTKYMGSKRKLLPQIMKVLRTLDASVAIDAFSGSGCVSYAMKQAGLEVRSNDFLKFCYHTARATVENNFETLNDLQLHKLLSPNPAATSFIQDTFRDLYFDEIDSEFLDSLAANIGELESPYGRSIALAAASRASMKKRPRGLFTYTSKTGDDGRRDLRISLRQQFIEAVSLINATVFNNGRENIASNVDVFEVDTAGADLVYLDPPYVSNFSDCDYTRRYHFVEGFCSYWRDSPVVESTKTKKIRSYETAFSTKSTVHSAFERLFDHFKQQIIAVSYSSNGIPSRDEIVAMLRELKRDVTVHEFSHRYHHGNQAHKVGDNNNEVIEYLFIAK